MRKLIVAAMCLSFVASTFAGSRFRLKSRQTGRIYGPFKVEDGEKVLLGESEFTVIVEETEDEKKTPEDEKNEVAATEAELAARKWLERLKK